MFFFALANLDWKQEDVTHQVVSLSFSPGFNVHSGDGVQMIPRHAIWSRHGNLLGVSGVMPFTKATPSIDTKHRSYPDEFAGELGWLKKVADLMHSYLMVFFF